MLPKYLDMFFNQANKATLVETIKEAIRVEFFFLTYEPKRSGKIDNVMCKRTETLSKSSSKMESREFDVEKI